MTTRTPLPTRRTETATATRTQHTPLYRVLLHNDDVTPIEFVAKILTQVFALGWLAALKVTLTAHFSGISLVVVETAEQAEFHIDKCHSIARTQKWPMTLTMEPEG